jgi:hypothetical protein
VSLNPSHEGASERGCVLKLIVGKYTVYCAKVRNNVYAGLSNDYGRSLWGYRRAF